MLLMRSEDDLVTQLAERDGMKCRRVPNCEDSVLVTAVSRYISVVTVLDALVSDIINEFCATEVERIVSVAAFRTGVFCCHGGWNDSDANGRFRELIGKWQAIREVLTHVAIAVKAEKVVVGYGSSEL
jgi:hypothetical protein